MKFLDRRGSRKALAAIIAFSVLALSIGPAYGACGTACCCETVTEAAYRVVVQEVCHLEEWLVEKLKPAACSPKSARPVEMAQGQPARIHPSERCSQVLSAIPAPESRPDAAKFRISPRSGEAISRAVSEPLYLQHHSLLM